jgi:hypothetical protein
MNKFHKIFKKERTVMCCVVTNEMPKRIWGKTFNRRAKSGKKKKKKKVITGKRFETNGTEPLAALPPTGLDWTIPKTPQILQPTLNAPGGGGGGDDGGDRATSGSMAEASPKGSGKDVGDSGWMPPTDS